MMKSSRILLAQLYQHQVLLQLSPSLIRISIRALGLPWNNHFQIMIISGSKEADSITDIKVYVCKVTLNIQKQQVNSIELSIAEHTKLLKIRKAKFHSKSIHCQESIQISFWINSYTKPNSYKEMISHMEKFQNRFS